MTDDICFSELIHMKYVEWRINKFFDLPVTNSYCLDSPKFSLSGANWYLKIYTNGREVPDTVGWISIFLYKEDSTLEHHATYRMGIKAADGSELHVINRRYLFPKQSMGRGPPKLVKRSTLKTSKDALNLDGTLTVFCAARIGDPDPAPLDVKHQTPTEDTASQTSSSKGISTLIENFKDLYLSKHCADVRIAVKDREFLAHTHVLIARSKVFSSMFSIDMAEKNNGKVEITDCDPNSFEDFLLFLYTGSLDVVSPKNATSLYETAEKYDLEELKEECIQCMINEINIDLFYDILHIAAIFDETGVVVAVTDFFVANAKKILKTTQWTNFMTQNPSLANELILKYVDKHE